MGASGWVLGGLVEEHWATSYEQQAKNGFARCWRFYAQFGRDSYAEHLEKFITPELCTLSISGVLVRLTATLPPDRQHSVS